MIILADKFGLIALATKKFAPNKYSTLCAKHFEPVQNIESAEQIGYGEDFRLYPDAVPTISKIPTTSDDRQNTSWIRFV